MKEERETGSGVMWILRYEWGTRPQMSVGDSKKHLSELVTPRYDPVFPLNMRSRVRIRAPIIATKELKKKMYTTSYDNVFFFFSSS